MAARERLLSIMVLKEDTEERTAQIEQYEKTEQEIAAGLGVSDKTVGTQRKGMESTAEIPQLKTSIGADGKERPRQVERKPAPKPEPIKDTTPQPPEPLPVVRYAEPEPVKESPTHVDEPEPLFPA